MIFNQFQFLFIFLPIVILVFFRFKKIKKWGLLSLLMASWVFYGFGDTSFPFSDILHLLVLIADIVWVYYFTKQPNFAGSRYKLVFAISFPLVMLLYFKYSNFILSMFTFIPSETGEIKFRLFDNIILPAGISFFTFQVISFAIDRFNGKIETFPKLSEFALYISFFPQLVAGPIVRYSEVEDSIRNLCAYKPQIEDISAAIRDISIGLAGKVLIADTLGFYLEPMIKAYSSLVPIDCLYVILAYSFQIYFDFWCYSLMAIGLGRIFGFNLPENFNRPYETLNPQDFWRRWHITLSYWIRDYLYLPLKGNKHYLRNILIVFCICGLWHGAGWNFIIWGLYHACLVILYSKTKKIWDILPRLSQVLITFALVSFGWLLFIFPINELLPFLKSLLGLNHGGAYLSNYETWAWVLIAALLCYMVPLRDGLMKIGLTFENILNNRTVYSILLSFLFSLSILFMDRSSTFIYFRF